MCLETGKMNQFVKGLSFKYEDLGLDPQHVSKNQGVVVCTRKPSTRMWA